MTRTDELIAQLESTNSDERNLAALALMDIGEPIAVSPLFSAIFKHGNEDNRGTLVYAVSYFDCTGHLEQLITLVLDGNFEVCWHALEIIESQEFECSEVDSARALLSEVKRSKLKHEHNLKGFNVLEGLF